MSGVTLQGDWTKWGRALRKLAAHDFKGDHEVIGEALLADSMDAFRSATSPEGEMWPWLSEATLAGIKKGRRRQILQRSGRLRKSITRRATVEMAEVGTNVVYAAIHQFGGEAGRKSHRVNIPAREYLGIGDNAQAAIDDVMNRLQREVGL